MNPFHDGCSSRLHGLLARKECSAKQVSRRLFPVQAVDTPNGAVLGHEEISPGIEGNPVGRGHDAGAPLDPWGPVGTDLVLVVIVAELLEDLSLLVEEGDAALDLTNGGEVPVDGGTCGKEKSLGNLTDELAVKRHVDDAHVGPIRAEESGRGEAGVYDDLVEGAKLVGFPTTAKGGEVLAGLVKAVDIVRGVAVGNIKVAVWCDIHAGQANASTILELVGNCGCGDAEDDLAIKGELEDFLSTQSGTIDEFTILLFANYKAMQIARGTLDVADPLTVIPVYLKAGFGVHYTDVYLADRKSVV